MVREIHIKKPYLYLPVAVGQEETLVELYLVDQEVPEKIGEWLIPVDSSEEGPYEGTYMAELPMKRYMGRQIRICGDLTENFLDAICNEERQELPADPGPAIHFRAQTGWINDPNGMVFQNGTYHLYFQFNPFNVCWNNMTWGHAVSQDLLHWKQEAILLEPDAMGTMFSGCALENKRGLLNLPEDALLYYYTSAGGVNPWSKGKEFTQSLAYSLDHGATATKLQEPVLPTLANGNRDPKVFYHEASSAYIMVLYLDKSDYAIFRSTDLLNWEMSQKFSLEGTWECPNFFRLEDEQGEGCWIMWTASGQYYPGDFDGYTFTPHGNEGKAYINELPYAAQMYENVEDRVISIPWLRLINDGRNFSSAFGIPVEMTPIRTEEGFAIRQLPVRELSEQMEAMEEVILSEGVMELKRPEHAAWILKMKGKCSDAEPYIWKIGATQVSYDPASGSLKCGDKEHEIERNIHDFLWILDDTILEIFFDGGRRLGTFVVERDADSLSLNGDKFERLESYRLS